MACPYCKGTHEIIINHPVYGPEVTPCPDCDEDCPDCIAHEYAEATEAMSQCDDIKLDQPLSQAIADLQAARVLAEKERDAATQGLVDAENLQALLDAAPNQIDFDKLRLALFKLANVAAGFLGKWPSNSERAIALLHDALVNSRLILRDG